MKTKSKVRCLKCKEPFDGFTRFDGTGLVKERETPPEGAASVCIYCGHVAIFTGNGLEIRAATENELLALTFSRQLLTVVQVIRQLRSEKKRDKSACM